MVKKNKDTSEELVVPEAPKSKKSSKKKTSKKTNKKAKTPKTSNNKKTKNSKKDTKKFPTLKLTTERDIVMDFASKVYQRFDKIVKSIVLFGSSAKNKTMPGSDIDVIIIVDDASINFDNKLIIWYREELGKIMETNPYKKDFHITTMKLTTWWNDLIRGDPTVINIIRYGEPLIDFGGFFDPLKALLQQGRIRPQPESVYAAINRVPDHIMRSRLAEMGAIEGCYWAMVDASQALLMALQVSPPSPEHIPELLKQHCVDKKLLKGKYIDYYNKVSNLHRDIIHGKIKNLDGDIIDGYQEKSEDFFKTCIKLIDEIIEK
ncbi:hypothetical protein GF386_05115 [Candidatus Pacearchaeota archaeon]|nr:hypothetical protein [Candidatus Pacearchaeota archaeon]MBD3283491.1 hypothetical protein [Candidatus Pacearchaeota archaeon]